MYTLEQSDKMLKVIMNRDGCSITETVSCNIA